MLFYFAFQIQTDCTKKAYIVESSIVYSRRHGMHSCTKRKQINNVFDQIYLFHVIEKMKKIEAKIFYTNGIHARIHHHTI